MSSLIAGGIDQLLKFAPSHRPRRKVFALVVRKRMYADMDFALFFVVFSVFCFFVFFTPASIFSRNIEDFAPHELYGVPPRVKSINRNFRRRSANIDNRDLIHSGTHSAQAGA